MFDEIETQVIKKQVITFGHSVVHILTFFLRL